MLSTRGRVHLLFLDVFKAIDRVPHRVALEQLLHCGIQGRLYRFVAFVLADRTLEVPACGITRSPRDVRQGVPQSSVLTPLLFKLAMGAIPGSLQRGKEPHVNLLIYGDDIMLCCIRPTPFTTTVPARMQKALNAVSA